MKRSRIEVAQTMESTGLVALFYHPEVAVVKNVVNTLYKGGTRLFEFTHRGVRAASVFEALAIHCEEHCPEMILGVGSVTDAATASQYINLGAEFVVTPVFREDIAIVCNRRKVLWSPGCASLTEIAKAEEFGCEIVKLFPASTYGPGFIKAVLAPQPWTKIMPTGGITADPEDLTEWFEAGAVCVGLGSQLLNKGLITEQKFDELEQQVTETIALIKSLKSV